MQILRIYDPFEIGICCQALQKLKESTLGFLFLWGVIFALIDISFP